jgi:hypothetical protein
MNKAKTQTIIPGAITQDDIDKLNFILDSLFSNPCSYVFRNPVNYDEDGLTDYLTIVETPMDLSTVKLKLKENKYISAQEVIDDIMLIWKNCKKYNIEGSEIYKYAEYLEKQSKKAIEKFYKVKFAKTSKFTFMKDYEDDDFLPPKSTDNNITFEEKVLLSDNIKRLSPEGLSLLMTFLKNNIPEALIIQEQDKYKISIGCIKKCFYDDINLLIHEHSTSRKNGKIKKNN